MLADSIKIKGLPCFQDNWVGFDEFKPITVIIGKNNSGKSHLIDLVELITSNKHSLAEYDREYSGVLTKRFIRYALNKTKLDSDPNSPRPSISDLVHNAIDSLDILKDDIRNYCSYLENKVVRWRYDKNNSSHKIVDVDCPPNNLSMSRLERCLGTETAISGSIFLRILAERDIVPEKCLINAQAESKLNANGKGATEIISRYLLANINKFPSEVIQSELFEAFKFIVGSDCNFKSISVRQPTSNGDWEVYLEEPIKGFIPLSASGSGLKTVLLVLLNLIVVPVLPRDNSSFNLDRSRFVFAFEELENNLHPALLRRLFDYLTDYVKQHKCHLFLTTHSSVALDYFSTLEEAQILQVTHDGTSASVRTIEAHFDKVGVLNDLGAKPSDLLQANGIIWLEGPSDRIYFNRFIELYSGGRLREGSDYQCAFYGGSVLANTTFSSPEEADAEYANLLNLNHNIAVICDSDITDEDDVLKQRVNRVKEEVEKIENAFLWITEPKEIENYLPGEVWQKAEKLEDEIPDPSENDCFPSKAKDGDFYKEHCKKSTFRKTEFAGKAVQHVSKELLDNRFDMKEKMQKLIATIEQWNN